jgi:hypothetical protein
MGGRSALGYGQLRNKCNYFYLSTDDEHEVWEGDQPLVMDNSETNVIIFIYLINKNNYICFGVVHNQGLIALPYLMLIIRG